MMRKDTWADMEIVSKFAKWRVEVCSKKNQLAGFSVKEEVIEGAEEFLKMGGFSSRVRCMCRDEKEGAGGESGRRMASARSLDPRGSDRRDFQ
eukprot:2099442-Prorocentrum_lima.AAC.1